MTLHLRWPRAADEAAVMAIHRQMQQEDFPFLLAGGTWSQVLTTIRHEAAGVHLAPGRVPADFLLAEVRGQVVGRVSIRRELNAELEQFGGHIGYAVAPAYRGRGYATEILTQAVARLASYGVEQILVMCEIDNLASARVIEKCGGVFEDIGGSDQTALLRYWIRAETGKTPGQET